jgi:RNA polymerase sigma-70 factor (ECF subfamily)
MGIEAQSDTELELISRCQAGDRQAFNRLVMTYQNLVYNFLYRLAPKWNDLDDLAQEVFVKVYHSVKHLRDRGQFKTWLHQIAVRVYVDEYRRRKKTKERFVSDEHILETQADPQATPDQQLERAELHRRLQEVIAQLPDEFRLAIVLREIQDLSYEEIAKTLNCSIGTVRSRIFRGRQLLQQMLKELRVKSWE